MPGLIAASAGLGGWTYGGSILTFAFPMLLFIAVAAVLFVLFTKPHTVPGHRYDLSGTAIATAMPGKTAEDAAEEAPPKGSEG